MIQKGYLSLKEMIVGIAIVIALVLLSGILLLYFTFDKDQFTTAILFFLLGIFAILAAVKYTIGKSPYGYKALGDLFVFIFFGIVGVMGSFFLMTLSWHWITIPGAVFTGGLSMAVLNMNNMRDYESDMNSGKMTMVVKMGIRWATYYQISLISLSFIALITILAYKHNLWTLICLIPSPILVGNIIKVSSYNKLIELDGELKKIALTTFFITLLLALGVYLSDYQ